MGSHIASTSISEFFLLRVSRSDSVFFASPQVQVCCACQRIEGRNVKGSQLIRYVWLLVVLLYRSQNRLHVLDVLLVIRTGAVVW